MSEQKIAVITGGNGRLGKALVGEFAEAGWQVVATGRSDWSGKLPEGVSYHQFDAGDGAACEAFWTQIAAEFADAEFCLVNNAGGYIGGGLQQATAEDFEGQMRSNYFAAVHMTRGLVAAIPSARIINIISSGALRARAKNVAYDASKAAEMHFFQSIQQEFEPRQYQITNLYPSSIALDEAITFADLAAFVQEQADRTTTYYLRDVTLDPR